jgi:hypothetical protein
LLAYPASVGAVTRHLPVTPRKKDVIQRIRAKSRMRQMMFLFAKLSGSRPFIFSLLPNEVSGNQNRTHQMWIARLCLVRRN